MGHSHLKLNKVKKSIILCSVLLLLVLIGGLAVFYTRGNNVDPQGCSFTESARELRNPGRGYYNIYLFEITDEEVNYRQLVDSLYQKDKDTSLTLIEINLQEYREREISKAGLINIDALFHALKRTDKQLIVRFLYDWAGENEKYEPESLELIKVHIGQLKKIINKHSDQIFMLQGVLVGNWGEMNGTRYSSNAELRELVLCQAEELDSSIYLSVRMPSQWRGITRIKEPHRENLMEDPLAARLGLYNDGMLGNESDYGTYGTKEAGGEGRLRREDELSFQNELCRYVPNGGEAINDNSYNDFKNAIRDLGIMHVTYLNKGHDEKVLEKWKNTKVTGGGCFHGKDQMIKLFYLGRCEHTAWGLIKYGIEALLLLWQDTFIGWNRGICRGSPFCERAYGILIFPGCLIVCQLKPFSPLGRRVRPPGVQCKYPIQLFLVGPVKALFTESFLQEAGSGFGAVFIISIGYKSLYHGFDIVKDFIGGNPFCNADSKGGLYPQSSGCVDIEGSVGISRKPQIAEGGMGLIFGHGRKTNL